ncbi:MAG TPA: transcription elongation factor GreA [Methylomirabilota bacterium]|nr:transcription elongation factor GreA [Methylomirabilota bacterium]
MYGPKIFQTKKGEKETKEGQKEIVLKQIRFTKEGYEKLKSEYETLLKQRPFVIEDLKKAREMGDLSENGYYKASRAKLSFIDSRLQRIAYDLKHATIITVTQNGKVAIGCHVSLLFEDKTVTFQIVGDLEANPSEGKISLLSPLGKALVNKKVGEEAMIETPTGKRVYKIATID